MKKVWLFGAVLLLGFATSEAYAGQNAQACIDQGGNVITIAKQGAFNGHGIGRTWSALSLYPGKKVTICHFPLSNHKNVDFIIVPAPV